MIFFKKKTQLHTPLLKIKGYDIKIIKKNIKHIYFKIIPQKNTILVSAPKHISSDQLNRIISAKKRWLLKHTEQNGSFKTDITDESLTDTSIMYLGKNYSVKIMHKSGRPLIQKDENNTLLIYIQPGSNTADRQKLIETWYRKALKKKISVMIEKWQPVIGVQVNEFGVKKMKTRWGSCNICAHRIWLNFYLIKLAPEFLEYVVVHEMVHLIEKRHNARFKHLMHQFIPEWPELKKQLNQYGLV